MVNHGTYTNIDYFAAKFAQKIVEELVDIKKSKPGVSKDPRSAAENTVTKALGVLQEHGVYACFLYIMAKEQENKDILIKEMLSFLGTIKFPEPPKKGEEYSTEAKKVLEYIAENITTDLERLLLAREALEQMLIYARYGIKARD